MTKSKFTENKTYLQFFTFEVLNYFDSIITDENFKWIEKYFNILMREENNSAEKFNIHHIRPCCTFKDEIHTNRKQTKKLGDEFNGNLIKLSVYNHLFAHFYLWKIFNNKDLKEAFQRMCGQQIKDLTEDELKDIARLKEECARYNLTEEEKKENRRKSSKNYINTHPNEIREREQKYRNSEKGKENQRKRSLKYYNNNKEKVSERKKKYRKNNKDKISQYWSEYYKNNKDKIYEHKKEYRKENEEKCQKYNKEYNQKYFKQLCYDPKKEDFCTLGALRGRIYNNKELYKNINPKDCIIN